MKNEHSSKLFEALASPAIQLRNRIVMAPMTRARAIGGIANELMALYYAQRHEAGLIITEGTAPSRNGMGYARIPGIYTREQMDGWRKITTAVHSKGSKIFLQLMHTGRVAHKSNLPVGGEVIAPSNIAANTSIWTDSEGMQRVSPPRAMVTEDIEVAKLEFVRAALNAVEAGFDGVELHAANGYLLEQFLNPHSNQRNDRYGGSVENRSRFIIDVTNTVVEAVGRGRVGVRISPYSTFNEMPAYPDLEETYNYLSNEFEKLGLLYIHLIDSAARLKPVGLELITTIRQNFSNLLILNGGYDKHSAEQALDDGADAISFGSKFIANPDLPSRLRYNLPLDEADVNTFYTAGAVGYTDYARVKMATAL